MNRTCDGGRRRERRALCVMAALTAACGDAATLETASGAQRAALYGAAASPDGTADDAVLHLRGTAYVDLTCTATLVASNLVVTALHCVARTPAGGFQCTPEGELIPNPDGAGTLLGHVAPESVEFYAGQTVGPEPVARGSQILSTFSDTICRNDIAFVLLDRTLDLPIRSIRLQHPTAVDEAMTFIGYGLDEQRIADWRARPRKRLTGQRVRAVGPDSLQEGVTDAPPRTLVFEGPSACWGDSGGPALSEDTGAVTGVFSLLSGQLCNARGTKLIYTRAAPFKSLAEQAFSAAGQRPWLEGEPDPRLQPNGGSCSDDGACQSGACVDGRCAPTCSAGAACPSGYACNATTSVCSANRPSESSGSCALSALPPGRPGGSVLTAACALAAACRRARRKR
ncbi:MAG TPA: trypsin-like serine protease [Polyangiaceae bacterium]